MYETSKIFGLLYVFMGDVLSITSPNVGSMCTGVYRRDETFRNMEDTERNSDANGIHVGNRRDV